MKHLGIDSSIPTTSIRERPVSTKEELGDRQILIKVHAWAINLCDRMLQTVSSLIVKYPVILVQDKDMAGTVEAVGSTAASNSVSETASSPSQLVITAFKNMCPSTIHWLPKFRAT
jgi:NADPH:quinone reductase-like Zn-dependent oxidoreductase